MSDGPFVIIAAFWTEDGDTESVRDALKPFDSPDGYPKGAVVGFRREVAMRSDFARDLGRFDLADVHDFSAVKPNGGLNDDPERRDDRRSDS